MLISTHFITAGYAGEGIGNPLLAFLSGIVIHFILDAIPHTDTIDGGKLTLKQLSVILIDLVVGALLIIFLLKPEASANNPFWWGAFGGILPDIFDCIPLWQEAFRKTKIGGKIHYFHELIQRTKISFVFGFLVQFILLIIFSYLYLIK